jgi:GTPase involved in cell partitioning and DNA repair
MFVDEVEIFVRAGNGGDGAVSFRHEKSAPRGGPDGGDGGDGGSVILVAQEGVDSLAPLTQRKHWNAEEGQRGGSSQCTGGAGADLTLHVPPGTIVFDAEHGFRSRIWPGRPIPSSSPKAARAATATSVSRPRPIGPHVKELPAGKASRASCVSN